MVPHAATHLRLARPSRDLLRAEQFWVDGLRLEVLYRAGPEAEGEHALLMLVGTDLVDALVAAGGTVLPSRNPYWDHGGVTIADPDGYRLVLTERTWG